MTALTCPHTEALDRSQALLGHILSEIKANYGKISFARYMELALYAPGLGYYSNGSEKFGTKGDFITAPLLSPLFSHCIARQCQAVLDPLEGGDILEIGAGNGQMAADILLALEQVGSLPAHYFIVELSAELQLRQRETITSSCPQLLPHVQWLTSLPADFRGIILGNEVCDAMPVHRFQITKTGIQEMEVIEKDGQLMQKFSATTNPQLIEFYESKNWPTIPYQSEINLHLKPWIQSLADILKAGLILLIDYGFGRSEYYHPDRSMGTFKCHYRHQHHSDALLYPGLQDLTAHVDFTAIAESGSDAGLDVLGYTHQAAFLISCGLVDLANATQFKTEKERAIQNHAIQQLTSPQEMGELFKVIALGREIEEPLLGFELMDRRYTL